MRGCARLFEGVPDRLVRAFESFQHAPCRTVGIFAARDAGRGSGRLDKRVEQRLNSPVCQNSPDAIARPGRTLSRGLDGLATPSPRSRWGPDPVADTSTDCDAAVTGSCTRLRRGHGAGPGYPGTIGCVKSAFFGSAPVAPSVAIEDGISWTLAAPAATVDSPAIRDRSRAAECRLPWLGARVLSNSSRPAPLPRRVGRSSPYNTGRVAPPVSSTPLTSFNTARGLSVTSRIRARAPVFSPTRMFVDRCSG